KTIVLTVLFVAALLLTACSPDAGLTVVTKHGTFGCQTWYEAALAWVNCRQAGDQTGVIEDHPDGLGHDEYGRWRVRLEDNTVLWFEPVDVRIVP
ncbi:MAG: hypothetical protein AAB973_01865, partial [Patescibacteria group bacterium]